MNCELVRNHICNFLCAKAKEAGVNRLVIGVSGGIDSAVVSTLCAITGMPTSAISIPIFQNINHKSRADEQLNFLISRWNNVSPHSIDLSYVYTELRKTLPFDLKDNLADANTRSRLRMTTLYAFANEQNGLVVGTGNKVEDYGVGFFTKYGDGGVDISPVGDLTKTEVRELAEYLNVPESIIAAAPSDGLWNDNRTDEEQIGATYSELEWVMKYYDEYGAEFENLSIRESEVLNIFIERHCKNAHKMKHPSICEVPIMLKLDVSSKS